MKIIRLLTMTTLLAATTATAIFAAPATKEEKPVIGSIRPKGEVKPADLPGLAKITFDVALKAARAAVPGTVIMAELEVEDGNLMYSFRIVGKDKSITEVEIDAGNGKVLNIDKEEAEEDDKASGAKKAK